MMNTKQPLGIHHGMNSSPIPGRYSPPYRPPDPMRRMSNPGVGLALHYENVSSFLFICSLPVLGLINFWSDLATLKANTLNYLSKVLGYLSNPGEIMFLKIDQPRLSKVHWHVMFAALNFQALLHYYRAGVTRTSIINWLHETRLKWHTFTNHFNSLHVINIKENFLTSISSKLYINFLPFIFS
jgi:hypothetical protein